MAQIKRTSSTIKSGNITWPHPGTKSCDYWCPTTKLVEAPFQKWVGTSITELSEAFDNFLFVDSLL